jgi:hypothetical protein
MQQQQQKPFVEVPEAEPGTGPWLRARAGLDVSGADAAKAIGCSAYGGAEDLAAQKRFERRCTDAELLEISKHFQNIHTTAGHANETPIAEGVSRLLFKSAPLHAPKLCKFRDPVKAWCGATPDRLLCDAITGEPVWPLVPIECKFSFKGVREHPLIDHVMQTTMQMAVLGASENYLSYGTRLPREVILNPTMRWRPDYNASPLDGTLVLRVFRVEFCTALWQWMQARMEAYRVALNAAEPSPTATITTSLPERIHDFVEHVWFDSPHCLVSPCREYCLENFCLRHPRALEIGLAAYLPPRPNITLTVPRHGGSGAKQAMWEIA